MKIAEVFFMRKSRIKLRKCKAPDSVMKIILEMNIIISPIITAF